MSGLNKKALAIGVLAVVALASMAMVYYTSYAPSTITVKQLLNVSVELKNINGYAPGIFSNVTIGNVSVGLSDPNTTNTNNVIQYRVIMEIPSLSVQSGQLGNIAALSIQVWQNGKTVGILSPITPSLIITKTYNETASGNIGAGGIWDNYTLTASGIAWASSTINLGVKASVQLLSVK